YAAVKYFGARRGLLLAAAAGGVASSTAVTITNARRAGAREGSPRLLAAGVAIASAGMFLRVIGIVAALQPDLLLLVAPALIAAAVTAWGSPSPGGPRSKALATRIATGRSPI